MVTGIKKKLALKKLKNRHESLPIKFEDMREEIKERENYLLVFNTLERLLNQGNNTAEFLKRQENNRLAEKIGGMTDVKDQKTRTFEERLNQLEIGEKETTLELLNDMEEHYMQESEKLIEKLEQQVE